MRKIIFIILILILTFGVLSGIKNKIESTKLFQVGREIKTGLKESLNEPEIETYDDLISIDNVDIGGVKRVNLNWDKIGDSFKMLKGTPIPDGYELVVASDDYIQISDDFNSNIILSEQDMLDFLKSNYLPSDVEFVQHKSWFEKQLKTKSKNEDIGEYTYKSLASGYTYIIKFEYHYIEKNGKEISSNYYSHVTINRKNSDK
ncbi:MAG: hypothetical protein RR835_12575 [Peptostreptococcaceae bacterium]